jgi:hypothetical protein
VKLGSIPREVIGNTTWVKNPTIDEAVSNGPTQRRLLLRPADLQIPTPNAATSRPWAVIAASIKGRTGEPRAVSSLMT